jgi:outer membrane protein TolC
MRKQVAADVASAYVDAALASDLVAVAQGRGQVEEEQVRVITAKVANGKMAPVDQLREEAELADAKQALVDAQTKASLAVVTLKGLIGLDQNSDVSLADDLDALETRWGATPTLSDALAAANARPEIAAARAVVDAARSQSDAAKAFYAPQVSGFGMADLNARLQSGANGSAGYTVGVVASLPLVDGGARSASTAGAQAQIDRASASLTGVQNKIAAEVAGALLRVAPAASQVDAARAGLTAASKASDLANMRYEAGKAITAERLDALYALTRAQANVRQAVAGELQARLALVRATGGEIAGR